MQSGGSRIAIVQSMRGLSAYRNHHVTELKKAAHRCHRNRVRQDLKLVVREALDEADFETQPMKAEALDAWDIY